MLPGASDFNDITQSPLHRVHFTESEQSPVWHICIRVDVFVPRLAIAMVAHAKFTKVLSASFALQELDGRYVGAGCRA